MYSKTYYCISHLPTNSEHTFCDQSYIPMRYLYERVELMTPCMTCINVFAFVPIFTNKRTNMLGVSNTTLAPTLQLANVKERWEGQLRSIVDRGMRRYHPSSAVSSTVTTSQHQRPKDHQYPTLHRHLTHFAYQVHVGAYDPLPSSRGTEDRRGAL